MCIATCTHSPTNERSTAARQTPERANVGFLKLISKSNHSPFQRALKNLSFSVRLGDFSDGMYKSGSYLQREFLVLASKKRNLPADFTQIKNELKGV